MAANKRPPQKHLHELAPGQRGDFFALLTERTRGHTREGKPYYHCRLRDARRTVSLMVWADDSHFNPCENEWHPGQFFKLRAVYQEHERYGPQIQLEKIRAVTERDREEGFDEAQFVESSRHAPAFLLTELRTVAENHIDAPLRALVLALIDKHADALARLPATRDRAYPYRAGLLEHTLSVARIAVDLAERYAHWFPDMRPPLDVGLVAAGAILHGIGRVIESDENAVPTVAGKLFGHQLLGRDLVRDAAREHKELPPERVQLLEHVLLTTSNGAEPIIPEAVLLRHAVALDLEMAATARALERDTGPGPFTERGPGLNRMLLKVR
jgi:3'-5' exoribonuclease